MGEFDWWSVERLEKLVNALQDCEEPCGDFGSRMSAPEIGDTAFWRPLAVECGVRDSTEDSEEEEEDCEPGEVALAREVHSEIHAAREAWTQVSPTIAIGDLGAAESRLMLSLRGVRSIVYVASHDMEPLWTDDGIRYHTLIVSSSSDPGSYLASQLGAACTFLSKSSPSLLCSSCPKLRATLAAAMLHYTQRRTLPVAEAMKQLNSLGVATNFDATEAAALDEFAAELAAEDATASPRLPPTADGTDLPTPGATGKRAMTSHEKAYPMKAAKLTEVEEMELSLPNPRFNRTPRQVGDRQMSEEID